MSAQYVQALFQSEGRYNAVQNLYWAINPPLGAGGVDDL